MQKIQVSVGVSEEVKLELNRKKKALSGKKGRSVSFDDVLRELLGWS